MSETKRAATGDRDPLYLKKTTNSISDTPLKLPRQAPSPTMLPGSDGAVDTKGRCGSTFGNDSNGADVGTKCRAGATFGNNGVGFIRVRKRKLKGGHRDWRAYRARTGTLASTSTSFDLVKAVRVDGKPRHEFVLGLGSQKDGECHGGHDLCWFWAHAVHRMIKHGLAEDQRDRLLSEMVRKGARLPTIAECEEHARNWPLYQSAINGLISWLTAGAAS